MKAVSQCDAILEQKEVYSRMSERTEKTLKNQKFHAYGKRGML